MPTHVALLRGVNVGGHQVPMADLRAVVAALGHSGVSTYIQSGNILFTPAAPSGDAPASDITALAAVMEQAIAARFGFRAPVIIVTRDELADVIARTPFPDAPNRKFVHAVFLPTAPGPEAASGVAAAEERSAAAGSKDRAVLIGRVLYLHTPEGFGRSGLVTALLMRKSSPVAAGTARNWGTVMKLLALCDA